MVVPYFSYEWTILLSVIIILIIAKIIFISYIVKKIRDDIKNYGNFRFNFMFGVFLFFSGLLISRIFFMIFDFYLTSFDPDLYYIVPNIFFWKAGIFIGQVCSSIFIFITDKNVLKFKFKGVLAYICLGVTLVQTFYPISNSEEFTIISTIGILTMALMMIIPIIFIYVGYKTPKIRFASYLMAIGMVIYFLGAILLSEFITQLGSRMIMYTISAIVKIIGLLFLVYGSTRFIF